MQEVAGGHDEETTTITECEHRRLSLRLKLRDDFRVHMFYSFFFHFVQTGNE